MEETVIILGGGISLEGRFLKGAKEGGVVITHPHPRYGGSMDNNVVWTAVMAFQVRGWATLRFNFRGVGGSGGAYGNGLLEVEDLAAALNFLKARTPGPHLVVGYSFGAFVAAHAMLKGLKADGVLMIAPPIAFMELAFLPQVPRLRLIIAGDRDDICPLADLQKMLAPGGEGAAKRKAEPPKLTVVAGADHFFRGLEEQLFKVLRDYPWPEVAN
ncbi:MAG: alpha/beta fold hydrolase [Desulfobaccales bacterium]|nr:alpha/beta fold hydrolase [Desulfobaccales bacterium]